jgi:hypothetical protein
MWSLLLKSQSKVRGTVECMQCRKAQARGVVTQLGSEGCRNLPGEVRKLRHRKQDTQRHRGITGVVWLRDGCVWGELGYRGSTLGP